MNDHNLGDLLISGLGNSAGGKFRNARIDGKGTINGDVECREFSCNGLARVEGNVRTENADINGLSTFEGNFLARRANMNGKVRFKRNLQADELHIDGLISVKGDCQAENLTMHGGLSVDGLLNAETIHMKLSGHCRAKEIGCGTITVTKQPIGMFQQLFSSLFPFLVQKLTADIIEGDDVQLTHTIAETVHGKNVKIGPGCIIGKVTYTDSCHIDPSASVKFLEEKGFMR